jgi:hypothetical protein
VVAVTVWQTGTALLPRLLKGSKSAAPPAISAAARSATIRASPPQALTLPP